jgi:hypothetical protein
VLQECRTAFEPRLVTMLNKDAAQSTYPVQIMKRIALAQSGGRIKFSKRIFAVAGSLGPVLQRCWVYLLDFCAGQGHFLALCGEGGTLHV